MLFDIHGFDTNDDVRVEGADGSHGTHSHHDSIASFTWREARPLALDRVEAFLGSAIEMYGTDLLRYKGVLNVAGRAERIVFQGVHAVFGADCARSWGPNEPRESVLVFIGRNLPRARFERGLAECIASDDATSVAISGNR
jgi:G3E family GTPase